jgi:hypothetical protein
MRCSSRSKMMMTECFLLFIKATPGNLQQVEDLLDGALVNTGSSSISDAPLVASICVEQDPVNSNSLVSDL